MISATLSITIISFLLLVGSITFVLKKVKFMNPYNLSIYLVLVFFWVSVTIYSKTLEGVGGKSKENMVWYIYPLLVVVSSLIQVFVRLPLGWISAKLNSRKTVILGVTLLFLVCELPFFFSSSVASLFVGAIGVGIYSATFGLDTVYFSENWSMKHCFTASLLTSCVPWVGTLIFNIIDNSFKIAHSNLIEAQYDDLFISTVKYLMIGAYLLSTFTVLFYKVFVHEHKSTIGKLLDDEKATALEVPKINYRKIIMLSAPTVLIGLSNKLVSNTVLQSNAINSLLNDQNQADGYAKLIGVLSTLLAIGTSFFVSLYLVKKLSIFRVMLIAKVGLIGSLIFGTIIFITKTTYVPLVVAFVVLVTVFFVATEYAYFGVVLQLDHYNPRFAMGVFLTMRSAAYSAGDAVSLETTTVVKDGSGDMWIVVAALSFAVLSLLIFTILNRKALRPLFELVTVYELSLIGTNESVWKPNKVVAK